MRLTRGRFAGTHVPCEETSKVQLWLLSIPNFRGIYPPRTDFGLAENV